MITRLAEEKSDDEADLWNISMLSILRGTEVGQHTLLREFQNHTDSELSSALPLTCVLGQITYPPSPNFPMYEVELIRSPSHENQIK